jgi:vitamin B12 transporter
MFSPLRRAAASLLFRSARQRNLALITFALAGMNVAANAVVVRGRVTDALGKAVPGGRVQLIMAGKVEAIAYAEADGTYEIRDSNGGRFTLLGYSAGYLPAIGVDFYGGVNDTIEKDVVLARNTVRQDVSVAATGIPTPLPQLTAPVSVIPEEAFATRIGVIDEMRQTPGAFLVQSGQAGGVTSLFMRGGNSTANLVLIDGIPAEDIGGTFDYGTVMSTGIGQMELYRGPNSAIFGTDAGAAVITISTPRGYSLKPVINYSGDAGNLHTWRNEVTVGGTHQRLDYYAALSRFDTSNAVPLDRFHSVTSAGNVGYDFDGNTTIRFTIRNGDSVGGVPGPYDFQGISSNGSQGDQDLYSAVTFENRYKGDWHNLVRYSIARKREQEVEGQPVGTDLGGGEFVGNTVTIRGANGYSATGQAQLNNGNKYDRDSNRDQLYYQSDYTVSKHFMALFGFRYDNERGSDNNFYDFAGFADTSHEVVNRTNFEYNVQFQGSFWDRLFYSAGGAVEKNHLYGIAGTPKIGLAYVPVRPSSRFFHGTRLRANVATGVQEPTLDLEFSSLYGELLQNGGSATITALNIPKPGAERSRTYDVGVDQNIFGEKLVLKAGYYHNVFDHQLESLSTQALLEFYGIGTPAPCPPSTQELNGLCPLTSISSAYVNSLAFRAQGAEGEILWHPTNRLTIHGGYTYLYARVVQSFSSDELATGGAQFPNPNFPLVAIGVFGPLKGGRPFRRPPNTGFFAVDYHRSKFTFAMKGAMASRSDDSTDLYFEDANFLNILLLPNRDLDFGYVKLDMSGSYQVRPSLQIFTQVDNLLNDQHIGPIGFPGLPLTVRAGVKIKLFGD